MVSPPPAIEKPSMPRWRARSTRCPWRTGISNTPTGPFQTMVPACLSMAGKRGRALRADVEDHVVRRDAAHVRHRLPRARRHLARDHHVLGQRHLGHGHDLPSPRPPGRLRRATCRPESPSRAETYSGCRRRRSAGPPSSPSAARSGSLVDTLEPATIATSGRTGCASALPSASSSAAISGPAQAILANFATPCVVASARCAVPKASLT